MINGRMIVAVTVAVVACVTIRAQQVRDGQAPAPGSAVLSGVLVLADSSAAPVRRAVIEITSGALAVDAVYAVTDENGRFEVTGLPSGAFVVTGRRPGFLPSAYGAKHPAGPGTPVALAAGQRLGDLRIRLDRGAVIAGTVFDQFGRPAPDLLVEAWRYGLFPDTGERLPQPTRVGVGRTVSDDHGRYRLFGLEPGEYVISAAAANPGREFLARQITDDDIAWARLLLATPPGSNALIDRRPKPTPRLPLSGNAPMFYSSAASLNDATRVVLGTAEERSGVDIVLRSSQSGFVMGQVSGPLAAVRNTGVVRLIDLASTFERKGKWDDRGNFGLSGIPSGQYVLTAAADSMPYRGRADVFVDGGRVDLVVNLQNAGTVSGRVNIEGAANDATLLRFSLQGATRLDAFVFPEPAKKDGTFVFSRVPAGAYRLRVAVPQNMQPGLRARSAMSGEADLLDTPLVVGPSESVGNILVTLVSTRSEIAGEIRQADGAPATDDTVLVFSADRQFWGPQSRRTQWVRPSSDGHYSVRDLPAGNYLIAAVADIEPGQWNEIAFLEELAPFGVKITLADGEKKIQNIKVGAPGGTPPYSTR